MTGTQCEAVGCILFHLYVTTLFEIWLIIFSASTYWLFYINLGLEWFSIFSNFHLLTVVHTLWFEVKCAGQFHHPSYEGPPHWTSMHGICQLQRCWKCFKIWGWELDRKMVELWSISGSYYQTFCVPATCRDVDEKLHIQIGSVPLHPAFCSWFKCSVQDKVMEITIYTIT